MIVWQYQIRESKQSYKAKKDKNKKKRFKKGVEISEQYS
jgi:hypothetical protein